MRPISTESFEKPKSSAAGAARMLQWLKIYPRGVDRWGRCRIRVPAPELEDGMDPLRSRPNKTSTFGPTLIAMVVAVTFAVLGLGAVLAPEKHCAATTCRASLASDISKSVTEADAASSTSRRACRINFSAVAGVLRWLDA